MMKTVLTIGLGLCLTANAFAQHKITPLWETKGLPVPESVFYSANDNLLYVSLIDGEGTTKDGKGGIALLNPDGGIKNKDWVTGLDAPKGIDIHEGLLYVSDITALSIIDIKSGNEINRIEVAGAIFLNDVTSDPDGNVFISDMRANRIYKYANGKVEPYMEGTKDVNGLKYIAGYLYALVGTELWQIDSNKNKKVIAKGFEQGGDGLEPVGNGDFLVTCWAGLIYYVKANGEIEKMLDVVGKMNTADLGFNPESKTLYVPTFNSNSVVAYKLD